MIYFIVCCMLGPTELAVPPKVGLSSSPLAKIHNLNYENLSIIFSFFPLFPVFFVFIFLCIPSCERSLRA